jgi:hypothetical protein
MTDVVAALGDLAASLDWPDGEVDVSARALALIEAPRGRARWPYVAAAAVAAIAVGVPVAAHQLAVGGVRIVLTGEVPPEITAAAHLGRQAELRVDAPRPPSLGNPAAAYEGEPLDGYTEVWPGPVIISSFPGTLDDELVEKRVYEGSTLERTTVDGEPAYWIGGKAHGFLYLDERGDVREETLRLSDHALIWTRDGTTYRIESSLALAETRALAESMF